VTSLVEAWLRFVERGSAWIPGSPALWAALFVAARLLYVGYISYWLRAQDRRGALTSRWGDRAHDRFARRASWLMNVDGVLLAIAIAKHPGQIEQWREPLFVLGWALVAFGILVTVLTARALGLKAWLWQDFFVPSAGPYEPRGLYRIVDDPKYVLGYAHAYGWALVCFSATGLVFALFAHVAILTYNALVERPHFLALKTQGEEEEVVSAETEARGAIAGEGDVG
jgi:hypothetical protein